MLFRRGGLVVIRERPPDDPIDQKVALGTGKITAIVFDVEKYRRAGI